MPPIRNPYQPHRNAKPPPLVVRHMPGNPNCVCHSCEWGRTPSRAARNFHETGVPTFSGTSVNETPPRASVPAAVTPARDEIPTRNIFSFSRFGPPLNRLNQGHPGLSLTDCVQRLSEDAVALDWVPAAYHSITEGQSQQMVSKDDRYKEESLAELKAMGMDTQGVTTELTEIFSPVVTQCLLDPMARLGVNYLTHAANFCPLNEIGDQLERTIDKNHKGCFFFTPQMIRDKKISLYNPSNKLEFYKEGPNKKYYHSYWRDALNTKRVAGNQSYFSTIEMGAFLPPWTIAECFRKDHEDAMLWMAGNAAAFPGNTTLFLSLKNEYATVFLKNMETT